VRRQLDRRLRERIMLAVSVVNGCRYCAWSHARAALLAGLPREEIRGLLDARLAAAPEADWPMLLYAQHWAERRGCPDPAARAALIERGGAALVDAVDDVLVAISFGNRLGIGLGRLLGQRPRPARLR
jgi:AhpD family alkylhydroperoxidase